MKLALTLIFTLSIIAIVGFTPAYAQFNSWITFDTGVKEVRSFLAEDRIERLKAEVNNTSAQVLNQEFRIEMLQAQKDELFKYANDQTIKRGLTDTINDALLEIELDSKTSAIKQLNKLRGAIDCDVICESAVDTLTGNHISTLEDNGRPNIVVLPDAHYVTNPSTVLVNNHVEDFANYSYNVWVRGYDDQSQSWTIHNESGDYYDVSFRDTCVHPVTQNCLFLDINTIRAIPVPDEYEFTFELRHALRTFMDFSTSPPTPPIDVITVAKWTITDS